MRVAICNPTSLLQSCMKKFSHYVERNSKEASLTEAIKLDESGMDRLVADGLFDAVTLNETQNKNVF